MKENNIYSYINIDKFINFMRILKITSKRKDLYFISKGEHLYIYIYILHEGCEKEINVRRSISFFFNSEETYLFHSELPNHLGKYCILKFIK